MDSGSNSSSGSSPYSISTQFCVDVCFCLTLQLGRCRIRGTRRWTSIDVDAFGIKHLNQGVTLTFDLQNLTTSSVRASAYSLITVIKIAQAVHTTRCSRDLTSTACSDLDL